MKSADYSGKWVALQNKEVVSSADNFDALIKKLKSTDLSSLTFAKIPQKGTVCVM